MNRWLLVLPALFFAPAARADIFFLDLNASYYEIKAAQAAAKKTGQELVVYPPMTEAERKAFYENLQASDRATQAATRACPGAETTPCLAAKKKQADIEAKLAGIRTKFALDRTALTNFLRGEKAKGRDFRSVILSGHDGTGGIHGQLGGILDVQLAEALRDAGFAESVRALHLWGCYTISPTSVLTNWKPQFPNASLLTGYDERAPLSDKPAGWKFLESVLEQEPKLIAQTEAKRLQAVLRSLPGALDVHAAVAACDSYANLKDSFDLKNYVDECRKAKKELTERLPQFECFLRARDPGCENPPPDTGKGAVREYYAILQRTDACADLLPDPIFLAHNRDQALRLLFYPAVAQNLERLYPSAFRESDEILANLGAPASLRIRGIGTVSRHEALERMDSLLKFLDERQAPFGADPKKIVVNAETAQLLALLRLHNTLTNVLVSLSETCVPYSWHEAGAAEKSTCVDEESLGRAGAAFALARPEIVRAGLGTALVQRLARNAPKGASPADDLLFRAQLGYASAHVMKRTDVPDASPLADRTLHWAERVHELAAAGKEKPWEDPSARQEQYAITAEDLAKAAKAERESQGISADEKDPTSGSLLSALEKGAAAARLRVELFSEPDSVPQHAERLAALEKLREEYGRAQVVVQMAAARDDLDTKTKLLERNRRNGIVGPETIAENETAVAKAKAALDFLEHSPEEAARKLAADTLDAYPLTLPTESSQD